MQNRAKKEDYNHKRSENGYNKKSENVVRKNDKDTKSEKSAPSKLKEKIFLARPSLITELYELKHFRNLYYVILAILLALFINSVAYDIIFKGEFTLVHNLIKRNFSDLHVVFFGWLCMFFVNLFTYTSFRVWAYIHMEIPQKSVLSRIWNYFAVICYVFYIWKALKFAAYFVDAYQLSVIGSMIISTEQVRLLMKSHAFIRTNAEKVLNFAGKKENKLPNFYNYAYFAFAPTLLYRDVYPRTKEIRWNAVAMGFAEVLGVILYISFVFECYFVPVCEQFRITQLTLLDIVWAAMKNTIPAGALVILLFYLVLHAWMNTFAELTRFADREFYQDWWNSTSFGTYYRKWNIVVHDWLYVYIYKDIYEHLLPGNINAAKFAVFFISSIFHEYVLFNSMQMFYPALFVMFFGFGVFLAYVKGPDKSIFNVLFLYGFSFGVSISLSVYVIEYCVRLNECSLNNSEQLAFYVPRTFSHFCFKWF